MLLWEELKDSDIPHWTTIRNHIKEIWDEHLAGLESEIKVLKIQLISIVMGTQFIIILPIACSRKGFLDHWHVVQFQPCFFHSRHHPLDWDEHHTDPQWASIWIETACKADRLSQSSRSSYRCATDYIPCRSRAIWGRSLWNSTAHRTADDILGLTRSNNPVHGSLDAEIAQYLNDSSTGTCSLTYWQVMHVIIICWVVNWQILIGTSTSVSNFVYGCIGLPCYSGVCCAMQACLFISKRDNDQLSQPYPSGSHGNAVDA